GLIAVTCTAAPPELIGHTLTEINHHRSRWVASFHFSSPASDFVSRDTRSIPSQWKRLGIIGLVVLHPCLDDILIEGLQSNVILPGDSKHILLSQCCELRLGGAMVQCDKCVDPNCLVIGSASG